MGLTFEQVDNARGRLRRVTSALLPIKCVPRRWSERLNHHLSVALSEPHIPCMIYGHGEWDQM